MRETKSHGHEVRQILIGMITDKFVLARISAKWESPGFFESPMHNLIAEWCLKYFRKYELAPQKDIEPLFKEWAESRECDKDTVALMERLLKYVSEEYDEECPMNPDYLLDVAGKHFNRVRYKKVLEESREDLSLDQLGSIDERLATSKKIDLGMRRDICMDRPEDWAHHFDDTTRVSPLFSYPGALGHLVGDDFQRSKFFSFLGVDKSGKSYWLIDAAVRALRARKRVMYFECGDMDEEQLLKRIGQRIAQRPLYEHACDLPTGFDEKGKVILDEEKKKGVSSISILKALKKVSRSSKQKQLLRISAHMNTTLTVEMISAHLTELARSEWTADVVVIDYADILLGPAGHKDDLTRIDETWKQLRRLSQEHHCLVLTATQTNAAAYGQEGVLTRKNFSGRKTKLAHVNGMLGLNVSNEDKRQGITRVNWVVRRAGQFIENETVSVAGSLEIACPCLVSRYTREFKAGSESVSK